MIMLWITNGGHERTIKTEFGREREEIVQTHNILIDFQRTSLDENVDFQRSKLKSVNKPVILRIVNYTPEEWTNFKLNYEQ